MSAKWRALQHRHRYTYSAVIFPQYYKDSLNSLDTDTLSCNYYTQLNQLIILNSTYAQVNHVKKLALAFTDVLKNDGYDENFVYSAAKFYLGILFLENSVPLHKTLVSVLAKTRDFKGLIGKCFRELCEEYGGENGNGKGKRFCVSRVALSMMSTPKLGYLVEIVEECAVLVGLDVLFGLNGVISETNDWSRPSPIVMEQCQDALSCIYYLLQRCPLKFSNLNGIQNGSVSGNSNVLERVLSTILKILKSEAFSRDCFVAAGVSFCSALQVCLPPEELGLAIIEGIFYQATVRDPNSNFSDLVLKIPYNGDLFRDIRNFSVLSRLCLIRGILTAIPRTVLNMPFVVQIDVAACSQDRVDSIMPVQTILYDGILPELCNYCENPTDSHSNFHALTVLQICLQQIKTSIQANLGNTDAENKTPISDDMGARMLRIIWNNLEDPLSQTVKQVHLIFDIFLDIQSSLPSTDCIGRTKLFLEKIASILLRMGPRCKGRYVPLASLTKRLGAKAVLDMSPDLMFEIMWAYIDDDVCCAATTFLKCFLERLRDECWSSDGVENGYRQYRSLCLSPFMCGLASGNSKLRSNLNTYALPVLLEVDVDSIFPMLAFISVVPDGEYPDLASPDLDGDYVALKVEQKVAVLVSLLKVSRSLALIEGDVDWYRDISLFKGETGQQAERMGSYALVCVKGIKVKILVKWLVLALTHTDDLLRIDAAESLFLNPKTSSLPSSLELSVMKEAMPLNMRCSSTAFQMKFTSLFRKFFARVRTALERQVKQGKWQPLALKNNDMPPSKEKEESVQNRAEDLFRFMKWLSSFLFFSCYPSAPYERKIMAMDLILTMNNAWSIIPHLHEKDDSASEIVLNPYCEGLTSPESTLLLVGSIVDSWDHLRESSFRILLHFPNPLPGISTPDMVLKVITWAKKLVCSPRVRESDAGALTLRLIFRKYVAELGWIVNVSCGAVSLHTPATLANGDYETSKRSTPVIGYVSSLIDWLQVVVELGEKDLSDACRNSFVHGVLLALRYTFEELDWGSDLVISGMKHTLEKLLELVMRITSLALWVVSADAWHLPEDIDDVVNDDAFLSEAPDGMDVSMSASGPDVKDSVHDVGPSDQIVMVGCWLAMKEVSLLLGTIIRKIPLSSSDTPVESCSCLDTADTSSRTSEVLLDLKQLETIGNHFLEVLLKMKHNGAIDKTRAGFTALCNRLLCSNDPRLGKLTESWMEQLMERTVATGQTVDDLLRRSAGIPAAFSAFFLSEPEGTPKKLLPKALRWLIDVAKRSVIDQAQTNISDKDFSEGFSTKSNQAILHKQESEIDGSERISKIRDEGVIPTVHAFNVLRAAFNDSNLATDTSGFSAEALIISIRSFSSSYWEVRNSACLAYTALVRRMIGFLNIQKRESARRALTGIEFFHRYPSLHPFLFDELRIATEFLSDGLSGHKESNLANIVHPSLCPMLILLSRLKPSAITSETGDLLDPFLFMPFIRKCSTQSNLRVRVLASRALAGLISNEKLPTVLLNIVAELPCTENQITGAERFNMIHGLLLQLSSLLDTNFRNLADLSKKELILEELIQVMGMRSWIGSPRLCPCPIVNSCFLRVLDIMLNIARTSHMSKCINAIWKLLWVLSSECLDVEAHGSSFYDPTIAELRKQAATSYFNCLFQTSKELDKEEIPMSWARTLLTSNSLDEESIVTGDALSRFQERLVRSMSDASYEVRIASLKWLFLFLKAMKSGDQSPSKCSSIISWTNTNLQVELVDLLTSEKNPKCTYYILKILFTWNELNFQKLGNKHFPEARFVGNMDEGSLFHFWDKLVLLYKSTRHAKTLEILLCCMGVCVKRFSDLFLSTDTQQRERSDRVYGRISYYVNLIELHADSSEPGNMRKAAAESMVASGLLKQAELVGPSVLDISRVPSENLCSDVEENDIMDMYARKILDVWSTCIKLLEDEDVNIRNRLAVEVQKCFGTEDSGKLSQVGIVPSQVDKVINLSFEHLSSVFSHWIYFFEYLARWVLSFSNNVISSGDLVRRVFDKETDNHHEEKLMICQICCFHLQKLPISNCWGGACEATKSSLGTRMKAFLLEWRQKFLQRLISFAGDVTKQGGVDWIGGLGNHKDAFLPLYSSLLGIYATSKCIFQKENQNSNYLLSDVVALTDIINPFLGNPLIHALYVLLVELHEEAVEAAAGNLDKKPRRSALVWEGFDPYFLLR